MIKGIIKDSHNNLLFIEEVIHGERPAVSGRDLHFGFPRRYLDNCKNVSVEELHSLVEEFADLPYFTNYPRLVSNMPYVHVIQGDTLVEIPNPTQPKGVIVGIGHIDKDTVHEIKDYMYMLICQSHYVCWSEEFKSFTVHSTNDEVITRLKGMCEVWECETFQRRSQRELRKKIYSSATPIERQRG